MDTTAHKQASMKWNLDRDKILTYISEEDSPETLELLRNLSPNDLGGWRRVSRHSASMNSAYKCMATLRLQWPTLEFQVRPPDHRARWKGEIWARRASH